MTDAGCNNDDRLHAYIDGELDKTERQRLLLEVEHNADIRASLCELRNTKDWVQFAFEGETAPTRSLPGIARSPGHTKLFRVAASLALLTVAFGAGWFGQLANQSGAQEWVLHSSAAKPHYVLLHIGASDRLRHAAVLERTEQLLGKYRDRGTRVEIIATAGGLDLLRSDSSPYVQRISKMMESHTNVRFFACSNGLKRLRAEGIEPALIRGVSSDIPGADHLIQRLNQGWTYIRI